MNCKCLNISSVISIVSSVAQESAAQLSCKYLKENSSKYFTENSSKYRTKIAANMSINIFSVGDILAREILCSFGDCLNCLESFNPKTLVLNYSRVGKLLENAPCIKF